MDSIIRTAKSISNFSYVISQSAYNTAYNSLPEMAKDYEKAESIEVKAIEYWKSTFALEADKWDWYSEEDQVFEFIWLNNKWNIQTNVNIG